MMARLLTVVAGIVALVGISIAEDIEPRFSSDKITLEQWNIYLAEIKALPNAQVKESQNQITVTLPAPSTTDYAFTTPKNPAYPAVVIRKLVQKGDGYYMARRGYYAGDSHQFEQWWRAFEALDEKIKSEVSSTKVNPGLGGNLTANTRQAEAETFATKWLDLIRNGYANESYALTDEVFRKTTDPKTFLAHVANLHNSVTNLELRVVHNFAWRDPPSQAAPPGIYALIEFDETYSDKAVIRQFVVLHSFKDAPFRVIQSQTRVIQAPQAHNAAPIDPADLDIVKKKEGSFLLTLRSRTATTINEAQQEVMPKARELCGSKKVRLGIYKFGKYEKRNEPSAAGPTPVRAMLEQEVECGTATEVNPAS